MGKSRDDFIIFSPLALFLEPIPVLRVLNSEIKSTQRQWTMDADGADRSSRSFFVAVHVGAGFHSPLNERALSSTMNRACLAAASVLQKAWIETMAIVDVKCFIEALAEK
ncbi:unnamed protein product [Ilex paraguariensis]|uniref:Uncharacterized protein n=1 Tax=Ilex paraguariensis TaxID=185542 RepID=A0ABC8UGB4_9AQUA